MLAALLLGSCRGDEGPMGPMGPAGPAGLDGKDAEGFKSWALTFTVEQNDWEAITDTDEPYFRCVFENVNELDNSVLGNNALLTVYRLLDDDYNATLPITKLHKETKDDGDVFYTQLIDYEFAPGAIRFYVTNSDFYMDDKPETMDFKVVVHYY